MAHRKDQKQALRRERERREAEARAAQQRKRLAGYGIAGAIAVAAVVVVAVLLLAGGEEARGGDVFPEGGSVPEQRNFELQAAARAAGCELKSSRGSGGATHTATLDERVNYKQNPPTTGRHYQFPADDGLYSKAPADEALVHSLEHGRVIVWVKPGLPEEARRELRALFDEDTYQMLMVPRRDMPYQVAATAWNRDPVPGGTGRTLACDRYSDAVLDAIRTFRDEHRSNGPEPVP